MEATTALVVFIIIVALFFDYTNGNDDAANSIATVVRRAFCRRAWRSRGRRFSISSLSPFSERQLPK